MGQDEKDWGPPTHSERSGWKVVGGGAKRSILRPQPISLGVVQWIPGVLFGESFFPKVLEAPLGIPHIDAPGSAGIFWRGVWGCVCALGIDPENGILRQISASARYFAREGSNWAQDVALILETRRCGSLIHTKRHVT